MGNRALIEQWIQASHVQEFTILLGHTPNYLLNILDLDIDLCLAGHTHGGQIQLPFIGPLVTLSSVPREWALGYQTLQNLHVNVSAGIGAEHSSQLPSIRFNCPPTMTLFTIKNPNIR
jgi:predicted MPP superfamily phosphohydrolase